MKKRRKWETEKYRKRSRKAKWVRLPFLKVAVMKINAMLFSTLVTVRQQ